MPVIGAAAQYINKRTNATKMQKKEISELLRSGKEEKARIRVRAARTGGPRRGPVVMRECIGRPARHRWRV